MGFKENLAFFKKVIFKNMVMYNRNWTMVRCLTKRGIKKIISKSYSNLHINVGWSILVAHVFKSKLKKIDLALRFIFQASMADAIIEKDHPKSGPKIMLNDAAVESNPVDEKSQESEKLSDQEENGEEMEFEIPEEEISQTDENGIEAVEVGKECRTENEDKTADGTKVDNQNTTENLDDFQAKKKVVKMRGAEDYISERKNDLTKYENRKDSVTRLDNKIGKSSDQSESSDLKDLKQDSKNIQIDEIQKIEVRESTDLESEMFYEDELDDSRMPLCKFYYRMK